MTRSEFMEAWRNDDDLAQTLTPDDHDELFLSSLFTVENFINLFDDYCIEEEVRREIGQALINSIKS